MKHDFVNYNKGGKKSENDDGKKGWRKRSDPTLKEKLLIGESESTEIKRAKAQRDRTNLLELCRAYASGHVDSLFPKSLGQTCEFITHGRVELSKSVLWHVELLRFYSKELTVLLEYEKNIERKILRENKIGLEGVVTSFRENEISSLMLLESSFSSLQLGSGLNAQKELRYGLGNESTELVKVLAYYYSAKAEGQVDFNLYHQMAANYGKIYESKQVQAFWSYVLSPWSFSRSKYLKCSGALSSLSSLALVDQMKVLSLLINDSEKDMDHAEWVFALNSCGDMPYFSALEGVLVDRFNREIDDNWTYDKKLLSSLDHYTCGNYSSAGEEIFPLLEMFPERMDYLNLFAKCNVLAKKQCSDRFPGGSLQRDIYESFYEILRGAEDQLTKRDELQKLSLMFSWSSWSPYLQFFCQKNFGYFDKKSRDLCLQRCRPYIGSDNPHVGSMSSLEIRRIERLSRENIASPCLMYQSALIKGDESDLPTGIDDEKRSRAAAKICMRKKNYLGVLQRLEEYGDERVGFAEQESFNLKIMALLYSGQIGVAIREIVARFSGRPQSIFEIEFGSVYGAIDRYKPNNLQQSIDLCVFHDAVGRYTTINGSKEKLHLALIHCYVKSNKKTPSEFFNDLTVGDVEREFFFRVCSTDVLGAIPGWKRGGAISEERVKLLQLLLQSETNSKVMALIKEEVNALVQQRKISEGVSFVNNSKITLHRAALKLRAVDRLRQQYLRYLNLPSSEEQLFQEMIADTIKSLKNVKRGRANASSGEKVVDVSNERAEQLWQIFNTLQEDLIDSSDYGVNSYLSMNVRHSGDCN